MKATRTAATIALLLFASGCDRAPDNSEKPPISSAGAVASAAPTTTATVDSRTAPPPEPAPENAAASDKSDAVYRLLAGGHLAKDLPRRDVDEGKTFDPWLKDHLTTTRVRKKKK